MNFTSSLISSLICGGTLYCSFEYLFDDKLCNGGTDIFVYPPNDPLSLQGMYVVPYFHPSNLTVTNVTDCGGLSLKFIDVETMQVEETEHLFYGVGNCTTFLPSFSLTTPKHAVLIFSSGLQTNKTYTVKRKLKESGRKGYTVTRFVDDGTVVQIEIERSEGVLCSPDLFPETMLSFSGLTLHQFTWEEDCISLSSLYEIIDSLGDPVDTEKFNATHNRLTYVVETEEFSPVSFYRYTIANNFKFFVQENNSGGNNPFYLSPLMKVVLMNVCPFTFVSILCLIASFTADTKKQQGKTQI